MHGAASVHVSPLPRSATAADHAAPEPRRVVAGTRTAAAVLLLVVVKLIMVAISIAGATGCTTGHTTTSRANRRLQVLEGEQ